MNIKYGIYIISDVPEWLNKLFNPAKLPAFSDRMNYVFIDHENKKIVHGGEIVVTDTLTGEQWPIDIEEFYGIDSDEQMKFICNTISLVRLENEIHEDVMCYMYFGGEFYRIPHFEYDPEFTTIIPKVAKTKTFGLN